MVKQFKGTGKTHKNDKRERDGERKFFASTQQPPVQGRLK